MSSEIVPHQQWEKAAIELAAQYAGFESAADLTPDEQMQSLATLVPVALQIVDEARNTIERQTNELNAYKIAEIDFILTGILTRAGAARWWSVSIPALDNLTPNQMIEREKHDDLLKYAKKYLETDFT